MCTVVKGEFISRKFGKKKNCMIMVSLFLSTPFLKFFRKSDHGARWPRKNATSSGFSIYLLDCHAPYIFIYSLYNRIATDASYCIDINIQNKMSLRRCFGNDNDH